DYIAANIATLIHFPYVSQEVFDAKKYYANASNKQYIDVITRDNLVKVLSMASYMTFNAFSGFKKISNESRNGIIKKLIKNFLTEKENHKGWIDFLCKEMQPSQPEEADMEIDGPEAESRAEAVALSSDEETSQKSLEETQKEEFERKLNAVTENLFPEVLLKSCIGNIYSNLEHKTDPAHTVPGSNVKEEKLTPGASPSNITKSKNKADIDKTQPHTGR
ncbi:hypothetical protein N9O56_00210, partial [Rickettsiales bacterium]|nr:hypothetical protein [Rickettsiales bacterium]